jgi:hypothetical protein
VLAVFGSLQIGLLDPIALMERSFTDFRGQYAYLILMMSVHLMARVARVVAPGLPHHVTQRGNRRQRVFFSRTRTSRSTSTSWRPRAKAAGRRFGPIA